MDNKTVTRAEWLQARAELLREEKAYTQARASLAEKRRRLPWTKVEKDYVFEGPEGPENFVDLFKGRSQLAIYHLMFGPGWEAPCPGCTQWANALNSTTGSFAAADARLIAVSRAPYAEIAPQRERLKWTFAWLSAHNSDFNYDFYASAPDTEGESVLTIGGEDGECVHFDRGENHGVSVFYRNESDEVFHTYSAYNRGIEDLNGAMGYFDLLPKGRAW